jgi:hypothetical protein
VQPAGELTTLGAQSAKGWALLLFGGGHRDLAACAAAAWSRLGNDLRIVRILGRGQIMAPDDSQGADTPAADNVPADTVLRDHCGAIARLYRPGDAEIVLLRPDGHLAWRGSPEATKLSRWLSMALDERKRGAPSQDRILPLRGEPAFP